jgi:hypothetical protein
MSSAVPAPAIFRLGRVNIVSRVADGIGRVLVQVVATFVVVGTAYLILFDPGSRTSRPLTPEQVNDNIAPIGRVSVAALPAVTAEVPRADPVTASAKTTAVPIEQPAEPTIEPKVEQAQVIAEPQIDQPEPITEATASEPEPLPPPQATVAAATKLDPNPVARPAAGFELKPDALGMHGIYQRTPRGITLYPSAIEPTTMSMESVNGLTGTLRLTPTGWIHLQILSDSAEAPPPGR